jgi:hypothetical protein
VQTDAFIIRRVRPWTHNERGERVTLPETLAFFVLDGSGEFAPASVAFNDDRDALIDRVFGVSKSTGASES